MRSIILCLLLALLISSCDLFKAKQSTKVIARVNDHYLYKKDLKKLISNKLSASDSAMRAKAYIDDWATKKLMLDKSKFNLPDKKQQKFDSLAQTYRQELYREAYINALIDEKITPEIGDSLIKEYYIKHKQAFRLNEHLFKLRYLELVNSMNKKAIILDKFRRFNQDDQLFLNDNTLAFKSHLLSDSLWVRSADVFRQLNDLDSVKKEQFYKPGNQFSIKDSISTYYIKIKKVRTPNSKAPYPFIKPKIKQILINRKKLTLSTQIKEEIKADAYEDKNFEIYD